MAESSIDVLKKRWWLIVGALVAALAIAWFLNAGEPARYEAEATLVVVPSSDVRDHGDLLRALDTLERRSVLATLARVPSVPETRRRAAQRAGLDPAEARRYRVRATVPPYTNLVEVTVVGPDPDTAATLANAIAARTRRTGRSMYRVFTLRILAEAAAPSRPVGPDRFRDLGVAALVGLAVGLLLAFLPHLRRLGDQGLD